MLLLHLPFSLHPYKFIKTQPFYQFFSFILIEISQIGNPAGAHALGSHGDVSISSPSASEHLVLNARRARSPPSCSRVHVAPKRIAHQPILWLCTPGKARDKNSLSPLNLYAIFSRHTDFLNGLLFTCRQ